MKKIIPLIIILVFIIGSVIIFTNKKRAYDVVYELDGFQIVESYDFNYYTFNIKKDDIDLDFAVDHEYTNKRKLLKGAYCNTTEDKITTCGINVFNETRMTVVKDNKLYSVSYNIEKNFNNEVLDTVDNVKKII